MLPEEPLQLGQAKKFFPASEGIEKSFRLENDNLKSKLHVIHSPNAGWCTEMHCKVIYTNTCDQANWWTYYWILHSKIISWLGNKAHHTQH